MNFSSEVSSCASRPIEVMKCINEIEFAKSVADLETSYTITGAKLQTILVILESKISSNLTKIISGDFKRRVFIREQATSKKTLSHGKACRMDDLSEFSRSSTRTNPSSTSMR